MKIGANPGQLFLHHQREVGGERGLGFAHEGERRAGSFSRLRRRDRSRRDEPVEHVALPGLCRSEPVRLPVEPRQLRKAGQIARLGQVEVAGADTEVEAGGSLDAVGAATVVDVIQVGLEELVFRIASLQLQGDQALSRLSRQRRQVGTRQVEPPCDLLGNRRGAPRPRLLHRRVTQGMSQGERVDARVTPEALILCCNGGGDGERGDAFESNGDAHTLRGDPNQWGAAAVDHQRSGEGLLLIDCGQRGEVGIDEERAERSERSRRAQERDACSGSGPAPSQHQSGLLRGTPVAGSTPAFNRGAAASVSRSNRHAVTLEPCPSNYPTRSGSRKWRVRRWGFIQGVGPRGGMVPRSVQGRRSVYEGALSPSGSAPAPVSRSETCRTCAPRQSS